MAQYKRVSFEAAAKELEHKAYLEYEQNRDQANEAEIETEWLSKMALCVPHKS